MRRILLLLFVIVTAKLAAQQKYYLVVGTYTSGKSEGIEIFTFDATTGDAQPLTKIKTPNPSYLAIASNGRFIYSVNEGEDSLGKGGRVTAFSFDAAAGTLKQLNQQSSGGNNPCYIAIDKTGRWITVGNYSTGNLAVLPITDDHSLGFVTEVFSHSGSGPNKDRQEAPHVHATVFSPDNKFLFVPDLGIDKIMVYSFNSSTGKLTRAGSSFVTVKGGSGPRHLDFHPSGKYAYLMQELSGTVTTFKYQPGGQLKAIQTLSALPGDFHGAMGSADIHVSPDGRFVYCSNRGESNSITIFSADPTSGLLTVKGHQSTLGKTPRNFNFDPTGRFLLVANQNSDTIVVFRRNSESGLLEDTGKRINVGNPVCIKWISAN